MDLVDLCDHTGRPEDAARFRGIKNEMAAIVNKVAWDGAWYARAYDDEGKPIGVSAEPRHKINLIPQAWSIIGEVADPKRAQDCMNSLHEKLNSTYLGRLGSEVAFQMYLLKR